MSVREATGWRTPSQPPLARTPLAVLAAAVALLLIAVAGRYGYHRDELYFLRAGRELAFGYVDQPPLSPALAAAMDALVPGSLLAIRLPSAVAAAGVVVLTGLLAREFGGGRAAQLLAAASMAVSAILLAAGHLLSTTTFDLLGWTALSWLLVRALRNGGRVWLAVGAVAGFALENKLSPAFLLGALLAGLLVVGPRTALRSPWPWLGGLVALVLWAPNLVWQATHGWPQLDLAGAIAAGSSGTSEPWYLFLPFQLVLISPLLVPVWAIGWWQLWTSPGLRTWRSFAVAYAVLAVFFVLTGGKPYYLAGLYPVLLAAGAGPAMAWAVRRGRSGLVGAAVVVSLVVNGLLMLPLLPVDRLGRTPVPDINYDAGETVGWPGLADMVRNVRDGLPPGERVVVLTRNYGQAGAVDRFAPELGPAYSGHNSYWSWGPPPEDVGTTVIAVGLDDELLAGWFGEVRAVGRFDNGVDLDNDEQGVPISVAERRRVPWSQIWPELRHLG